MRYRTRIAILIGFIILFLATAPLVVLYTAGYRWNNKKLRPEKVGIIFVRSRPSSANIYLDGAKRKETTPTRLRDLLPDIHELRVAKEGYTSWSKDLPVESGLTTFAEGVILWKETPPEGVGAAPAQALTADELAALNRADQLTDRTDKTTFRSDGFEIWTENQDQSGRDTVTRLSEEIRAITPYADTGWIIYETAKEIHAVERDGRDTRNDVLLATGSDLHGLAISSDGKTLYYLSGQGSTAILWKKQLQ
jgi:hypothetical protein